MSRMLASKVSCSSGQTAFGEAGWLKVLEDKGPEISRRLGAVSFRLHSHIVSCDPFTFVHSCHCG